jgi:hypothetical protein
MVNDASIGAMMLSNTCMHSLQAARFQGEQASDCVGQGGISAGAAAEVWYVFVCMFLAFQQLYHVM